MDHDRRPCDSGGEGKRLQPRGPEVLRELVLQTIRDIVPSYRRHQEQGTIEISTTPFYHPILPLLVNSRVDDAVCPSIFIFPRMRSNSLRRARTFIRNALDELPRGLWPSEGSVSEGMAELVSPRQVSNGWRPMKAFSRSPACTSMTGDRHRLYQPYRRDNITIFFRDQNYLRSDRLSLHAWRCARQRGGSRPAIEGNSGRLACFDHSRWRESLGLLPEERPRFPAVRFRRHSARIPLSKPSHFGSARPDEAGNPRLAGSRLMGRREFRHLDGPSGRS